MWNQYSWIPTGLFLIGHACHRIENGGGPRNISNPESGNSILLGTGASPPVSGYSILDTNIIKKNFNRNFFGGPPGILCPMTYVCPMGNRPVGKIPIHSYVQGRTQELKKGVVGGKRAKIWFCTPSETALHPPYSHPPPN